MMYYTVHNGRKKTLLHLMVAHNVYHKYKSRELITSLNHILASVSYEIKKIEKQLGTLCNYEE